MNLWLDDIRPAPQGWLWVKTDADARIILELGWVEYASLDHDLGACEQCLEGLTPDEWLIKHAFQSMPNCPHYGTGYTLVCWMEETGNWPKYKPRVHSANPVGRMKMQAVIDTYYQTRVNEDGC